MSNLHRAILHEDGKIKIAIRFIVLRYFTLFYYHVDLQPCQSNAVISIHCFCVTFHHQVDLHPIRSRNFGLGAARVVGRRRGGHIMGGTPVSSPPPPLGKDWKIGTLVIPLVRFLPPPSFPGAERSAISLTWRRAITAATRRGLAPRQRLRETSPHPRRLFRHSETDRVKSPSPSPHSHETIFFGGGEKTTDRRTL